MFNFGFKSKICHCKQVVKSSLTVFVNKIVMSIYQSPSNPINNAIPKIVSVVSKDKLRCPGKRLPEVFVGVGEGVG